MFVKISEQPSLYNDLEKKSVSEILHDINNEDKKVALAVEKAIPQIEKLVTEIVSRMKRGGRIFYMGAGTSGRLGVLDASEIPPTFGMDPSWVIGLIAGGDTALRNPVENAEDDTEQGWKDLQAFNINDKDTVIGIAALSAAFEPKIETMDDYNMYAQSSAGKVFMARAGLFDDLDCAVTWHPSSFSSVSVDGFLANYQISYRFKGVSSHAAIAPELALLLKAIAIYLRCSSSAGL